MRARLFVISSLALAALAGGASVNAAVAGPPQCCGDKVAPKPTTTTTQPKGPDDFQQKPTTTTVPKGPDDLAPKPPQGDDPNPNGPDDLAPAPKGGGVEPGPDTTGSGSGSDNYVPPVDNDATDSGVESSVEADSDDTTEAAAKQSESDRLPAFVIIFLAALVGALLALVATRFRRDDEDVEHV